MLKELTIRNYTIIEELHLGFSQGLSIITGETGAGKSILLGALNLILGERADSSVLLDASKKCIIEGQFDTDTLALHDFFKVHDLDNESPLIIRREILPSGKSRAFINDTPVTLAPLKTLGTHLVEMHRQMDSTTLYDAAYQAHFLDRMGKQMNLAHEYDTLYNAYKATVQQWKKSQENLHNAIKEKSFLEFQLDEIQVFHPVEGEEETLLQQISSMEHAREILEVIQKISFDANENETGPLAQLRNHYKWLMDISPYLSDIVPLQDRINSCIIELEDIYAQLNHFGTDIQEDPQALQQLHERYDQLQNLFRKHNIQNISSLLALQKEMSDKLSDISFHTEENKRLEQEVQHLHNKTLQKAVELTKARKKTAKTAVLKLLENLRLLGMPEAKIVFEFTHLEEPGPLGDEKIDLLFSANKGMQPGSVKDIASGGELSRLNLCIKSMIADTTALPTLVFDEIDTGISGAVAVNLAQMLRTLSQGHQVISITHSPIVAAAGDTHFKVFKDHSGNTTTSAILQLSPEERVKEIATMISGYPPTNTAIKNAEELLNA